MQSNENQPTLFYRNSKGQFVKGNPYRFRSNDKRTVECAKRGFRVMCERKFNGHKGKAMEWLGLCLLRDKNMLDW